MIDTTPRGGEQQDVYRMVTPKGPIFGCPAESMDEALNKGVRMMPQYERSDLTPLGAEE